MQCNETLWQLSEDAQGDLARNEERRLHLTSCPACSERLDALQSAVRLLRREPLEAPAPGFSERVMHRIALEQSTAAVPVLSKRGALIGVAVVIAALAVLGVVWAGSQTIVALLPGGALLLGFAGFLAAMANTLVVAGAVCRAGEAAARALPAELVQALAYTLELCFVLALLAVMWLAGRRRSQSQADTRGS